MAIYPIEAPAGGPQIDPIDIPHERNSLPLGSKVKPGTTHGQFRQWLQGPHARAHHSDGFLAFHTEPSYECPECFFHGFFVSDVCHRCGAKL